MKNSNIEWTDHTFNPWIGCSKVSPGCANCYAETLDRNRFSKTMDGGTKEAPVSHWGKGAPRHRTSAALWKEPLAWDQEARLAESAWELGLHEVCGGRERVALDHGFIKPTRPRVFCASLADWLDDEVPVEWLADLLDLIRKTPHLDWLLLTKRPASWKSRMEAVCEIDGDSIAWSWLRGNAPANVWIGTSVEDQLCAEERLPEIAEIPARVKFLSVEPLLGALDLSYWLTASIVPQVQWVIVGGESGPDARPMHPAWVRSLRDQCYDAGVPFFFKQWGEWVPGDHVEDLPDHEPKRITQIALDSTVASSMHMPFEKRDGMETICLVGKKTAGRLLDGVEHHNFPSEIKKGANS